MDFLTWDGAVSMAYAAEQLFLAAQLLTSDLIPLPNAIHAVFERHVPAILEHRKGLPHDVVQKLSDALADYRSGGSRPTRTFAYHLRSRLLETLAKMDEYMRAYGRRPLGA